MLSNIATAMPISRCLRSTMIVPSFAYAALLLYQTISRYIFAAGPTPGRGGVFHRLVHRLCTSIIKRALLQTIGAVILGSAEQYEPLHGGKTICLNWRALASIAAIFRPYKKLKPLHG